MKADKKVHFQEAQEHSNIQPSPRASFSNSDTESSLGSVISRTFTGQRHRTHSYNGSNNHRNLNTNAADKNLMSTQSKSNNTANTFIGRLLTVSPADELVFRPRDNGEAFDKITLTNTEAYPVVFKVKTTSPEKFRVRPSSGFIKPGKTEEIHVYLISDLTEDVSRQKFLVMATETQNEHADINQLFKDAHKDKIMQHKLRCSVEVPEVLQEKTSASQNMNVNSSPGMSQVEKLELQTLHMQRQLNLLLTIQFLTAFILVLIMLAYSCFGEELFTKFLALPLDFCHVPYGRKC